MRQKDAALEHLPNVYCVRAEFGTYAQNFINGEYAGIDYGIATDLSKITSRDELNQLFRKTYPEENSNIVIGQQVGQIARFLLEIKTGDYIITPAADTEWLHYGIVQADPSYYFVPKRDECPYRHRRKVIWAKERLRRSDFSVPFQNTIRSSLTVFAISQRDEFLEKIGVQAPNMRANATQHDPYTIVLNQVLELNDREFEILIKELLTALGFEGSQHTGKSGDGGVDVTGELNIASLAKVKLFVQAKRYKLGKRISANDVKDLRKSIPRDGQGAFITTADFQSAAHEIAADPNFPRIGLINGNQLVDLLIEHWGEIPKEFQERLGLRQGLVKA